MTLQHHITRHIWFRSRWSLHVSNTQIAPQVATSNMLETLYVMLTKYTERML